MRSIIFSILIFVFPVGSLSAQKTVSFIDLEIGQFLPSGTRIVFPTDAPIPHPQRREWLYFHFAAGSGVGFGPVSTMSPDAFILGCRFNYPDWATSYLHIFHMWDNVAPTGMIYHWQLGWQISEVVLKEDFTLVHKDITDASLFPDVQTIIPNNDFIGVDLSGVIMLLSALLVESERKRESLHQLEILGQYQLGLLAFVGGVALCYVFVFGMRLR